MVIKEAVMMKKKDDEKQSWELDEQTSVEKDTDPTLQDTIEALTELNTKIDQIFNGHILSRGRFTRRRRSIAKEAK